MPTCAGCDQCIVDRYLLRVAPDMEWHASCLKCADCRQPLDETRTCFVRDGKTYCRQDYLSRFTSKCTVCGVAFLRSDLVMRARDRIYHVDCFRCAVCERQLSCGDEYALTAEDTLCCRADLDVVLAQTSSRCTSTGNGKMDDVASGDDDVKSDVMAMSAVTSSKSYNNNNNEPETLKSAEFADADSVYSHPPTADQSSGSSKTGASGNGSGNSEGRRTSGSRSHKSSDQKTTRIRTVLNEKQLHTLRTCYGANPRPDALMKEQLVEMTGLSPRVIRVWFQNKRCKDKKRSLLLKQMQQHHQDSAVSMVAASPVRHDPSSSLAPVAVHQYQLLSWPSAFVPGASGISLDPSASVGRSGSAPLSAACVGGGPFIPAVSAGAGLMSGPPSSTQMLSDATLDLQMQPPPFQRLLNTFGNLSECDEDEDDSVVSLDDPPQHLGPRGGGSQLVLGADGVVTINYIGGGSAMAAATSTFGGITAAQHAVRC